MATNSGGYNNNDYYHQQPRRISPLYTVAAAIVVSLAAIALLAKLLRLWLRSLKEGQEADRRRVPPSSSGGQNPAAAAAGPQPPAPAAVSVEMARSVGPLVCTYRRADGWREAACAVCLAELGDGEAVRVLPACMHYFHAECVGEWLRGHDTCPLCRTALDPAAPRSILASY